MTSLLPTITIPLPRPGQTRTSSSSIPSQSSTSSSAVSSSSSVSPSVASSTLSSTPSTSSTSSTESISSSSTPLIVTRTTVVIESSLVAPPSLNTGSTTSDTSFLQNKVASGFVFSIVGVVGLIFIMFIATFFIRRRHNKRLTEDAVSFDPVTVGHDDLEKAMQSSSVGHGSHEAKSPMYSPPSLQYHGGPPPANYTPHMAAQLYAPPVRYSSPPLPNVPMQQQLHRHLSYTSAMSSVEDANYSRSMLDEMRGPIGRQIPDDIRRKYYSSAG